MNSDTHASGSTIGGIARVLLFLTSLALITPPQIVSYLLKGNDKLWLPMHFYRFLLALVGIKVRFHGVMSDQRPTFFAPNHISYLDIPVLGSLIPASFVAKADVASWPIFGFLAKLQNTAFIERRASCAREQRGDLRARVLRKENLILFPEGTSTEGQDVLRFKSSLFSICEEKLPDNTPVFIQPVTLACTYFGGMPAGRLWRPYYAWYGSTTLVAHLWAVFRYACFTVDVVFHTPVKREDFADRKELAHYCELRVREGMQACLTGRIADLPCVQKGK